MAHTLSSYTFETFKLLEQGHYRLALANVAANNLLAFLAVMAGAILARAVQHGS